MRALFARLDIDFDQWVGLTKTALRLDFRASRFMHSRRHAQASAVAAILGQVVFYTLMGGAVAFIVWFSRDAFLSATAVVTYVMFMAGTAALLDHNAAIVSPDDHAILGFRPINSRTYFASKLTNVLVYTLVLTTLFSYLPLASFFLRWGVGIGVAALVGVYGASIAMTLTMVVAYASLLEIVGAARLKRVLSYVQLFFSFFIYGGYFVVSRLMSTTMLAGLTLNKTVWILLLPPTWYASYLDLAAGRFSLKELVPAAASIGVLVMLGVVLSGRLSLDYAERLSAIASASRATIPARAGREKRAWLFTSGEARAVALLIRSQFANDMRFRMGILAILPLTLLYLFIGLSKKGTIGDAFVAGNESLQMVSLAMLLFPTMLKVQVGRSDAFRASWIFFSSPMDRTRMVRAAKNYLLVGFLLPYLVVVGIVLAYFSEQRWHLAIHLLTVSLVSHVVLQIATLIDPVLPFSKPTQKGRSSTRVFMLMMVIGVGSVVLPIVAPILYRTVVGTVMLFVGLIAVSVVFEWLTRVRIEAQAAKLEFEG